MQSDNIYILSCDTSTKVCTVAIHRNGQLLVNLETYTENSHAENLMVMVEQSVKLAKIELKDISAFALAKGPGSYTGLRIGCSSIKGLCFALEKPLIAISTLRIMAEGLLEHAGTNTMICPMIDAKRMEVYCGVYDESGQTILPEAPLILDENSFQTLLLEKKIVFAGNGANKCQNLFQSPNAIFLNNYHPLAQHMGSLAWKAFQQHHFVDLAYFEPEYLKEFYTTAKVVA